MVKKINYNEYMSPFLLEYKNQRYQSLYRNSRIKIANLDGFSFWVYIIYSVIMLGYSIYLFYKSMQYVKLAYRIIGGIILSFSIISPFLEIILITWSKKILLWKGIFYLITLELAIFLQLEYSFEFSPYSLWGLKHSLLESIPSLISLLLCDSWYLPSLVRIIIQIFQFLHLLISFKLETYDIITTILMWIGFIFIQTAFLYVFEKEIKVSVISETLLQEVH